MIFESCMVDRLDYGTEDQMFRLRRRDLDQRSVAEPQHAQSPPWGLPHFLRDARR
jgi:hypothetical protein